jgi:hypothetical protein
MTHDFQHRGQEECLSIGEQLERQGLLQRRQEWEESQRQPMLPEAD